MKWLSVKIHSPKEYLEDIARIFADIGSGGAVIDDPDLIREYALSGQWDAWEFPEEKNEASYTVTGYLVFDNELESKKSSLMTAIDELKTGQSDFSYFTEEEIVDEEDWANSWKQYFKVLKIGDKTIVKPSWEEYEAKKDDVVIELDPGMAFGTGNHATTCLAMELTEKFLNKDDTVIDVGTGSGIISIQAAKLGAKDVFAYDYDNVAVEAALKNVEQNSLSEKISIKQNDLLSGVEYKADLIIANIVADVILRLIPQLQEHLSSGGKIILSGIIEKRLQEIRDSVESHGYQILEIRESEGWYGLCLKKV